MATRLVHHDDLITPLYAEEGEEYVACTVARWTVPLCCRNYGIPAVSLLPLTSPIPRPDLRPISVTGPLLSAISFVPRSGTASNFHFRPTKRPIFVRLERRDLLEYQSPLSLSLSFSVGHALYVYIHIYIVLSRNRTALFVRGETVLENGCTRSIPMHGI